MASKEKAPKKPAKSVRGNPSKLIPTSVLPKEKVRAMGAKGGIASGIAKRRKKNFREVAQLVRDLPLSEQQKAQLKKAFPELDVDDMTVTMGIMMAHVNKSLKGDVASSNFIRDTAGEKPSEKHDLTSSDGTFGVQKREYTEEELEAELKKRGLPTSFLDK